MSYVQVYSIIILIVADICDTQPCQNGGSCRSLDLGRQYTCSCEGDFSGQDCEIPPDPCSSRPCKNAGVCTVNTIGEVDCQCTTGYSGAYCEIGTYSMSIKFVLRSVFCVLRYFRPGPMTAGRTNFGLL